MNILWNDQIFIVKWKGNGEWKGEVLSEVWRKKSKEKGKNMEDEKVTRETEGGGDGWGDGGDR